MNEASSKEIAEILNSVNYDLAYLENEYNQTKYKIPAEPWMSGANYTMRN